MRSIKTRLISSGARQLNVRTPASTCATRMPSFAATSVAASVEFTSPTTSMRSGRFPANTGSRPRMISAVAAVLPSMRSRLFMEATSC